MAPQSVARGDLQSGDRAVAGMPDRAKVYMGRQQPATGSHLPLGETASPSAVSPDFAATRMGRGFAGGLSCQAPSEGINHSRRRLSRIPSRKAAVAPTEICSALPMEALNKAVSFTGAQFNSHQPGYLSFSRLTNGSSN